MPAPLLRTAVITGAARGIGRAISLRLAQDGFRIVACDLPARAKELENTRERINSLTPIVNSPGMGGPEAVSVYADVSAEGDVDAVVGKAVEKFGGVDVMVANAGICPVNDLQTTSLEQWERVFSVNARGVFLCYRAAARQMIKQGRGGRIIGASSAAGKRGYGDLAGYTATKFAVRGLTQSAAESLAKHSITVNAYAPGGVRTAMLDDVLGDAAPTLPLSDPEEIAGLVSYLVKDEARFITGQTISINGGIFYD